MKFSSMILGALCLIAIVSTADAKHRRHHRHHASAASSGWTSGTIVAHPAGCPRRAFCGCGASVEVFGHSVRNLWLAAAWFKFPRAMPAAGMVAVRRGHVFVLRSHVAGNTWLVYDANSGRHATRVHERSINGLAIVNPRG